MELTAALNAIAGTTGLEAQGAANVIAGTDGLALVGALNAEATPVGVVGYQPTKLRTPGTSGNYASCPDSAGVSVTGDIDLRWQGSLDDWTPTSTNTLIGKDDGASQRSFFIAILSSGVMRFYVSVTGTSWSSVDSTASVPASDGAVIWVRVTRVSATGAVTFYTSADGVAWTQLGAAGSTTSGAIYNSTQPLSVGTYDASNWWLKGHTLRAEVRNGINGTVVANPDFTSNPNDSDGYAPDAAGNTWTLHGTAALANDGAAIPSVSGESPRLELQGVLNQLAGTTGLGVNAAATIWAESV